MATLCAASALMPSRCAPCVENPSRGGSLSTREGGANGRAGVLVVTIDDSAEKILLTVCAHAWVCIPRDKSHIVSFWKDLKPPSLPQGANHDCPLHSISAGWGWVGGECKSDLRCLCVVLTLEA